MRLEESPSALVASQYGWTGNMQRLIMSQTHSKKNDVQRDFYLHQKQHLEINPRHPIVKKLRDLVAHDSADQEAHRMAKMMFRTAVLRSGFLLQDTASFAKDIEQMMRFSMGIPLDEPIEEDIESGSPSVASESPEEVKAEDSASSSDTFEDKDEL
ncbi:unnamed protein product [Cyprideis torosa]|uniref:Uncharacterized protein n=1 Tax=Cyprideis torosa TaxID=163714 RepID=A0A7R8WTY7_9CRUS|nr:unnamed protein product [Cyprideis torosa]CAG0906307.1 unnamed protein product [Cyprideis torosa]